MIRIAKQACKPMVREFYGTHSTEMDLSSQVHGVAIFDVVLALTHWSPVNSASGDRTRHRKAATETAGMGLKPKPPDCRNSPYFYRLQRWSR